MKIYDCFTFFNELDILEIRLNILDVVVDYFVIVEGNQTFNSVKRDYIFEANADRFKKFKDKIIYVKVDDFPELDPTKYDHLKKAWILENFQRNAIDRGLKDAEPDDVILISDVDEIPNPEKVREYASQGGVKMFQQHRYNYFLNYLDKLKPLWENGTRMGTLAELRDPKQDLKASAFFDHKNDYGHPNYFRFCKGETIKDGGWHFSFLGGVDTVIYKIKSFSHQEYNSEEYTNEKYIRECLAKGKDIFKRDDCRMAYVPIDETYPKYILDHLDKYQHLVAPKPNFQYQTYHAVLSFGDFCKRIRYGLRRRFKRWF